MFGDNESVVKSSTTLHAKLHKRHNALSFHRVHEAIAAKFVDFIHMPGTDNPADVVSKQLWLLHVSLHFLRFLLVSY